MFNYMRKLSQILIILLMAALPICAAETSKGNSMLETEYSDYMSKLRTKIFDNWETPEYIEEGHASVVFKISRNGEILSCEISESSGNEEFDNSALQALNKAEPFDSFPQETSRNSLTIQYNFDTSLVKTDTLKQYAELAENFYNKDNKKALEYINLAINEAGNNCSAYFLYARRAKIYETIGDKIAYEEDLAKSKKLKNLYNEKKINSCKQIAEKDTTPYSYFMLAHAYDSAGDYQKAIESIDIAINMTMLNNGYKRYRSEILTRQNN